MATQDTTPTTDDATANDQGDEPTVADPDDPPANEPVRLLMFVSATVQVPTTFIAETSDSGKTVVVEPDDGLTGGRRHLEADRIFAGDIVWRDRVGYALYTSDRFQEVIDTGFITSETDIQATHLPAEDSALFTGGDD